jgi:hypothetical protein
VRRNGLPRSDKATLVEYFIRNENYLTLVTVVTDPVTLRHGANASSPVSADDRLEQFPLVARWRAYCMAQWLLPGRGRRIDHEPRPGVCGHPD